MWAYLAISVLTLALVADIVLVAMFFSPWVIPFYVLAVCAVLWYVKL